MSEWKRYRTRRLVEAKPVDHDGSFYNPRTGGKDEFHAGDFLIRDAAGKQTVERKEVFHREYEAVE